MRAGLTRARPGHQCPPYWVGDADGPAPGHEPDPEVPVGTPAPGVLVGLLIPVGPVVGVQPAVGELCAVGCWLAPDGIAETGAVDGVAVG